MALSHRFINWMFIKIFFLFATTLSRYCFSPSNVTFMENALFQVKIWENICQKLNNIGITRMVEFELPQF